MIIKEKHGWPKATNTSSPISPTSRLEEGNRKTGHHHDIMIAKYEEEKFERER